MPRSGRDGQPDRLGFPESHIACLQPYCAAEEQRFAIVMRLICAVSFVARRSGCGKASSSDYGAAGAFTQVYVSKLSQASVAGFGVKFVEPSEIVPDAVTGRIEAIP